jgi:hypothetical protein
MNLVRCQEALCGNPERHGHARAIFRDVLGIIIRSDAAIERIIDALRHAAIAGEKRMTDVRKDGERRGLKQGGPSMRGKTKAQ